MLLQILSSKPLQNVKLLLVSHLIVNKLSGSRLRQEYFGRFSLASKTIKKEKDQRNFPDDREEDSERLWLVSAELVRF
jgi:hypothetical protein